MTVDAEISDLTCTKFRFAIMADNGKNTILPTRLAFEKKQDRSVTWRSGDSSCGILSAATHLSRGRVTHAGDDQ